MVAEPANARIATSADELFTIRAVSPGATRVHFAQRRPLCIYGHAVDTARAGRR